jgi:hypothetical protein
MGGPIFNEPVEGVDDGNKHYGVRGRSNHGGYGVFGASVSFPGVRGESQSHNGVAGSSESSSGVFGLSFSGYGVHGESELHEGVLGFSETRSGVVGMSNSGPQPNPPVSAGVYGLSHNGHGVAAYSANNTALVAYSPGSSGIYSEAQRGTGVTGSSLRAFGVLGLSTYDTGVVASSFAGDGLHASTENLNRYAAILDGRVSIFGPLEKPAGSFKIDHPLDPANKYLHHSFVESPDMKNVYDGVVVLDNKGEAEIELPDWFGALNKDFRYQLTAIGAPGPNLYIAEEISDAVITTNNSTSSSNNKNSHFKVAGGTSGMKVSWQVTGIRKDPYAKAHPIKVEEDKPAEEKGYYIYPDLYSQPEEKGISRLLFQEEEEKEKKELLINENKLT